MATPSSFIAQLSSLAVITLGGEQRHEYLHGQITVATKTFNTAYAKIAAHCDFKGKMFSAMFISHCEDQFFLTMHHEAADASLAQLKKYGVFSNVEIEISPSTYVYGAYGDAATKVLKVLFSDLNQQHLQLRTNNFGQVICFNDNSLRYLCLLNENGKNRLNDILEGEALYPEAYWDQLEISAGIANIQAATMSEFVPQMLNFQAIQAIDFGKGCYMGQEVVARTKFLGKNKRATFILNTLCDLIPEQASAGNNIEIQLGDNWRRGGVINRVAHVNGKLLALAVMANDTEVGSVIRLKDTDMTMTVESMPYQIND